MTNKDDGHKPVQEKHAVTVVTTSTGADQYRIVASATFDTGLDEVWQLLSDWEHFLAVGLPGQTSEFRWLKGDPDKVPSSFEFVMAGVSVKEEIYERVKKTAERYRLCYKTLEPALGILEYDAVLELEEITDSQITFTATRYVRLASGSTVEMLAGMVESETQCLKEHFGH